MTRSWQSQSFIPAFQSILGDPTLRLFRVNPPQNVRKASNGLTVSLWWDPATEPGTGYHVYRTTSANGVDSSVQVTTAKLTGTSFSETLPTAGSYTYMVRATKLQTSGSGSFWNLSQGNFTTATVP